MVAISLVHTVQRYVPISHLSPEAPVLRHHQVHLCALCTLDKADKNEQFALTRTIYIPLSLPFQLTSASDLLQAQPPAPHQRVSAFIKPPGS